MSSLACQSASRTVLENDFFVLPDVGCSCWHQWRNTSGLTGAFLGPSGMFTEVHGYMVCNIEPTGIKVNLHFLMYKLMANVEG